MSFAEKLSRLQAFLDADDLHEEALDYVATHGYLTALSICPEQVPEREWIDALFAEPPHYRSDEERQEIETSLEQLKAHITRVLASDEDLELPCDLDLGDEPDDSDLRGWCIGFMEGVFLREEVWFEQAEEEVSELLLPIMVGSGLFDEQPEFDEIARDRHLVDDMVAQIPDLLTNLFLLCLGSFYDFTADRTINQLDVRHGGVVASAETALQDAQVAARTVGVALAQVVEQLANGSFRTGTVESQATVGDAVFLGQGDQRLGNATQFLGLGQGGFDQFVFEQRHRHVLEHSLAVRAGAAQVTTTFTMAHGSIPFQTLRSVVTTIRQWPCRLS